MAAERRVAVDKPASVVKLNFEIAELVKKLDTTDLVEVLTGRASWLLAEDNNQNQNQGSRADLA